ncbi:hypothetical protein LWI28_021893 [Acer negundo]|uniref:Uncharacterized protein n=1 Tax=Acer negundo TaxID=4023 RepID=A0AAD5J644_ACENE|nr:hypothetical protein LWI28_021893 [Acer negundo]
MKFVKPLNLFKELLRIEPSRCGRLLGLYIKDKHVDLAMSDPDNINAVPLSTVLIAKSEEFMPIMVRMFQNVIKAIKPEGIIVGYPYISFKAKPNGAEIENFIDRLDKTGKFKGLIISKQERAGEISLNYECWGRLCVLGLLAPILLKRTLRNIKSTKAEGLIVGYPSSSIIQKSDGAETKIFIDKLDKTGKFEGLKYTYWCTSLVSKVEQAKKLIDGLHKMWLFEGLKYTYILGYEVDIKGIQFYRIS